MSKGGLAQTVRCVETGEVYLSLKQACKAVGVPHDVNKLKFIIENKLAHNGRHYVYGETARQQRPQPKPKHKDGYYTRQYELRDGVLWASYDYGQWHVCEEGQA